MRHKISYDLFREMRSENASAKCAYVNIKFNDEYKELYVLMQEVNAAMLELNKNDTMAMLFKDPPIFRKEKLSKKQLQDSSNYYQQKCPKINTSDKSYYMAEFESFLLRSDNQSLSENISKWIDIENVIDWHIMLLLTNNSDGILKNFYLYKKDKNTPFRIAIWDYDHSFGRDGDNEFNLMNRELNCYRSILLDRLSSMANSEYLLKVKTRWFELRKLNIISQNNFEKHLSKNDKIIRKEVVRNFEKWPVNSQWYYDDSSYQQELDLMRDFVTIRINQLDKYFGSL